MTKITVHDTYLNKNITFFTNKDLNSKEKVIKELRIHDYLYFSVVAVKPANRIEKVIVPFFCETTDDMINVLFYNYKYLFIVF